jgi:hypothetical protein
VSRKGLTALFVIAIGLVALALGGVLYYSNRHSVAPPLQAVGPMKPKACTQEAKQCPDGSYVSRTGPNCEFQACP